MKKVILIVAMLIGMLGSSVALACPYEWRCPNASGWTHSCSLGLFSGSHEIKYSYAGNAQHVTSKKHIQQKGCSQCYAATVGSTEVFTESCTVITTPGFDSTCTTEGLSEGQSCYYCKEEIKTQTTIPAKGHSEETVSGYAATCTAPGLTDGKKCTTCGTTTVEQTTIPAKGHSYSSEWEISKNDSHRRYCVRGCGRYTTVDCEYLKAVVGENMLSICPICGRYGDTEVALQKQASITNLEANKPGVFIARVEVTPVENNPDCLAVITAVYARNGSIVALEKDSPAVTLTLPMLVEAPCKLVFVTIDELKQEPMWSSVEYTVENGNLVFTVNQLGMFLLIAE